MNFLNERRSNDGRPYLCWLDSDAFRPVRWADPVTGSTVAEFVMSILYLLSGLIALGLFVYLLIALLKPELF
jgi:K+-transporting ATPase KdpF subunit